ncbi:MAG: hypothetical protein GX561_00235 [Lentisphaerae bacterium]|nr:hypothetical protein [Lentisphaerota bacterium]
MFRFLISLFIILATVPKAISNTITPEIAWKNGFWLVLPDEQEPTQRPGNATPKLRNPIPIEAILPHEPSTFALLHPNAWNAAAIILALVTIVNLIALYRDAKERRNSSQAKQLKIARKIAKTIQGNNLTTAQLANAIKTCLTNNPATNLTQLAERIQQQAPQLAKLCREVEQAQFNSTDQAVQIQECHLLELNEILKRQRIATINALLLAKTILLASIAALSIIISCQLYDKNMLLGKAHDKATILATSGQIDQAYDQFFKIHQDAPSASNARNLATVASCLGNHDANLAWNAVADAFDNAFSTPSYKITNHVPEILFATVILFLAFLAMPSCKFPKTLGTLFVSTLAILVAVSSPRLKLNSTAITSSTTALFPFPHASDRKLQLDSIAPATKVKVHRHVGDYVFIEAIHASGWAHAKSFFFCFSPKNSP